MQTGLEEFFEVLKDVRKIALFSAGGLIVLPIAANLGGYSPPWPRGITMITTLMELVIVIVSFQLYSGASKASVTKAVIGSTVGIFACSTAYLFLYSLFVYQIPNHQDQIILGCGLSQKSLSLLDAEDRTPGFDDCPGEFYSLLKSAQWDAERVYTKLSVSLIRACINISWLAAFGSLACLCGVFVTYQRRRKLVRH